jgi:hypothetical protein
MTLRDLPDRLAVVWREGGEIHAVRHLDTGDVRVYRRLNLANHVGHLTVAGDLGEAVVALAHNDGRRVVVAIEVARQLGC